ncbi:MAG: alpha/beta fold hydrolase [Candidatus Omnitrophota bacterium]|nr:alpha/beta fold hydrolase [Candidatus Omnitrophota bacterium]
MNKDKAIEYRQWASSSPRAVLLLVHGLGAHAGRWEAMAEFFVKNRISSYAIESGDPARAGYFRNYQGHILALSAIAAKDNPGKNIFLVGESMGALLSFLFVSGHPELFKGLICLSPAFSNKCRLSAADNLKALAALFYNPKKKFMMPFDFSMCTRDTEYSNALNSDPGEYRAISAGSIPTILLFQIRAGFAAKKIATSSLFLIAGEDKLVESRATANIFKRLVISDKALVEFPGMYHSLSIELGKEKVFEEIRKWVEKRM